MTRASGGNKRSSWQTFHRRLLLLRRLIRGPADATTLIADVRAAAPPSQEEIYPPDARAALRHDMQALRQEFGCTIERRPAKVYELTHLGRLTLLDLPEAELHALAFLSTLINDISLPNRPHLGELINRISTLLPDEHRHTLHEQQRLLRIAAPQVLYQPTEELLTRLQQVLGHQQIAFDYRSSYAPQSQHVRHRVSPYQIFYRDGHCYLDAYCHDCGKPEHGDRYISYRLDRIDVGSLQVLPQCLPPIAPSRPTYTLRYRLSPMVARQQDIALWFSGSQVTFESDGSALVSAQISDLWHARQVLLRYREHCRILAPPELITMIKESVRQMLNLYALEPETATT
ncbi:MAG: WYL domain-containing protein [Chloroflexaceae bacterium]|nr:WYL domain-containing protein [Chloroflexaceae bacterium]